MELQFKHASINDLERIVDTYNQTISSGIVTADTEEQSIENKINWFNSHNPTGRPIWLILHESSYCGWISFSNFYGRPAYSITSEISLYLDSNWQNKGIGKRALQFAISQAPSLGIENILGFIFSSNLPSIKLFMQLGFKEWGCLPNVAQIKDDRLDLIILGLKVNE
ncbi:MAG: N-acetyltransferase family protein [Bacteroidia bacterium]